MINLNQTVFIMISTLMWSIVFHELGHLFYILKKGKKAKLVFDLATLELGTSTTGLNKQEYKQMLLSGIFVGITPIVYSIFTLGYVNVVVLVLYLFFGIKSDVKILRRLKF